MMPPPTRQPAHGGRLRRPFERLRERTQGRKPAIIASAMVVVMVSAMFGLVAQVARLQASPDDRLVRAAGARVVTRPVDSMRGDVVDRRGRLLATSRPAYRVIVDPLVFPGEEVRGKPPPPTLDQAIVRLADAMGESPELVGERVLWAKAVNAERFTPEPQTIRSRREIRDHLIDVVKRRFALTPSADLESPSHTPAGAERDADPKPKPPIRYLRIGGVLPDENVAKVRAASLAGVWLERVPVRQYPGEDAGPIIGKVNHEHTGVMGAERLLDGALRGRDGRITYIRDAWGRPLWIEVDQITPEERGRDARLSIDLELQRIVREELWRGVEEADAVGGRAIVVDPHTGEILAMIDFVRDIPDLAEYPWTPKHLRRTHADRPPDLFAARYRTISSHGAARHAADPGSSSKDPALARNRCVEDVYEPGSTFKSFVWAVVTDLGRAKPDEVFETGGGSWRTSYGRVVRDVVKRRSLTWSEILVRSSNIGMTQGAERLTARELHDAVRGFGFGSRTRVGLGGETAGIVTSLRAWNKYTHTSVAFGHEVAVTPVQMARAFCVFARDGELAGTLPTLTLQARDQAPHAPTIVHRTVSPASALLTREVLSHVIDGIDEKLARRNPPEKNWRYTMFGKSGTAEIPLGKPPEGFVKPFGAKGYYEGQYYSSFIAGAPLHDPRIVMLVVIEDPAPDLVRQRKHYGSDVAAPVIRRSLERILPYMGVPPYAEARTNIATR